MTTGGNGTAPPRPTTRASSCRSTTSSRMARRAGGHSTASSTGRSFGSHSPGRDRRRLHPRPGPEGAEAPDVAFVIAGGELTRPVVLIGETHHDLGPGTR